MEDSLGSLVTSHRRGPIYVIVEQVKMVPPVHCMCNLVSKKCSICSTCDLYMVLHIDSMNVALS